MLNNPRSHYRNASNKDRTERTGSLVGLSRACLLAAITASAGCGARTEVEPVYSNCNANICLECNDCAFEEAPVLEESFRLQNLAYQCLVHATHFDPSEESAQPMITYRFSHLEKPFAGEMYGQAVGTVVESPGYIGILDNETAVSRIENVRLELHETMHAFSYGGLGHLPKWMNEGFSIFFEETLSCGPKQFTPIRLEGASKDLQNLKKGLPLTYDHSLDHPHIKGAMFIQALREDYGWDTAKIEQFWKELRKYHKAGEKIETPLIRRVAEDMNGGSLDALFNLLHI